jgi:ABC-type antimicrobial peptide transport system permease subunit
MRIAKLLFIFLISVVFILQSFFVNAEPQVNVAVTPRADLESDAISNLEPVLNSAPDSEPFLDPMAYPALEAELEPTTDFTLDSTLQLQKLAQPTPVPVVDIKMIKENGLLKLQLNELKLKKRIQILENLRHLGLKDTNSFEENMNLPIYARKVKDNSDEMLAKAEKVCLYVSNRDIALFPKTFNYSDLIYNTDVEKIKSTKDVIPEILKSANFFFIKQKDHVPEDYNLSVTKFLRQEQGRLGFSNKDIGGDEREVYPLVLMTNQLLMKLSTDIEISCGRFLTKLGYKYFASTNSGAWKKVSRQDFGMLLNINRNFEITRFSTIAKELRVYASIELLILYYLNVTDKLEWLNDVSFLNEVSDASK